MNNEYKKLITDAGDNLTNLLINFDKLIYALISIVIISVVVLISIGILIGKYLL